jgi:phthiocerol/phenolphthiocerol synthesis type-I polyketide synthase D
VAGESHAMFVEVSPHPLLIHAIGDVLAGVHHHGVGTLQRDTDDTITFHSQLAAVGMRSSDTAPLGHCADRTDSLVEIPPTPWMHSRYWLANRPDGGPAGTHPLLGVHVEMPSGRDHVWQADVGTDLIPWLGDHRVHGQTIMPAAGFAEMVLAAGSQALGLPADAITVNRLEVEQMLPLDSRTQVTTHLARTADDRNRVEIHSRSAGGNWTRHAVSGVEVLPRDASVDRPGSAVEAGTAVSPADFYTVLRRTGAYHGPAFAALTRIVRTSAGSAEAEITLPDEATPHRGYHLHPVMLDAALQTLAAAIPAEALAGSTEATYLPVSMETLRVFGRVGRRARCRAELVSLGGGADKLGRITLMDDAGTPTAEVTGIYLRRVQRRTVPLPLAQKVFDTEWVDVSAPSRVGPTAAAGPAGSWLVLGDDPDTKALAEEFAAKFGSSTRRVIGADMSDESAVLEAFTQAAADPDLPPLGVVAFVGQRLFDGTDSDGALARARDLIWAVSATTRAVVGGWHGKLPRLWLIARNGLVVHDGESGDPAIGGLRGIVRVLAYEHPDLRATLVDLDGAGDAVATVITELDSPGNDDVIAWRGQRRYAERLTRATLGESKRGSAIRDDGSYIVTGGLGGLGLVVARWLVDSGAGRVVLNARSNPDDLQRIALAELECHAEIVFVQGDIASPGVAEQLVCAAEETGRPLCGVMHSAAVLDDGLITTLGRESLERVWAPKAGGALRLHEATAARELDWWVAFSSVASLLGSPGQAAYAAANAWLDSLVGWRRAAGLPATAINWGQWSEVGLARSLTMDVLDPISPAEGIEALESLVGGGLTRAGVARLRLDRAVEAFPEIRELGYFAGLVDELTALDEGGDWPGPDALRELGHGEVERVVVARLRRRISAIMGYSDDSVIDPSQPLVELGIDSLMAVRIRNTVRRDFGVEPPVALLLQGASLRDLAADLINQLGLIGQDTVEQGGGLRDRTQRRAAARQRAAARRKTGQRA